MGSQVSPEQVREQQERGGDVAPQGRWGPTRGGRAFQVEHASRGSCHWSPRPHGCLCQAPEDQRSDKSPARGRGRGAHPLIFSDAWQVAPAPPPPPASPPWGRRKLDGAFGRCLSRLPRDRSQPRPWKRRDHTQSGTPILLVHLSFRLPVPFSQSWVSRRWGH